LRTIVVSALFRTRTITPAQAGGKDDKEHILGEQKGDASDNRKKSGRIITAPR
jgi:hypothetical protein